MTEDGRFTGTVGQELPISLKGSQKYPSRQVSVGGKKKNYYIHRLAAYCFYGERIFDEGIVVRHLNGDKTDCSKGNIAIGTTSENHMDKPSEVRSRSASIAARARVNVERKTLRKLTDKQAYEVKSLIHSGVDCVTISKKFGVSDEAIYQIKNGETYKDIHYNEGDI